MKRTMTAITLVALATGCTNVETETSAEVVSIAGTAEGCAALTAEALGAVEASGTWVEAADALPAFCEVTAKLSPAEGSSIGVVYRLPETWNGKLVGFGGGGWAGNIAIETASEALGKGYGTLQTDGGHESGDLWDNSWALNPEAATDFAHRAVHEMTVAGKQVAASYYGQEHSKAYFQGCSTGGRMALMEAQRYPLDYDAISAGAPVYTLQVQTSAIFRNQTFAAGNGAGGFTAEDLALAQGAALASCDMDDGVNDGIIANPRLCSWQPAELECAGEKDATCLSPAQVTSLNAAYDGARASDDSWSMFPMSRGGEAGWSLFVGTDGTGEDITGGGGLAGLFPMIFGDNAPSLSDFSDADYLAVRNSGFAEMYEAKNPDLSDFFGNGGKLILWHGENDPGPSPVGTSQYAAQVREANVAAAEQMRYFTLPGVEHCRGGPGADVVDHIDALDSWSQGGDAPERLIGSKPDNSITRPHCAWPNLAKFSEKGDVNDPENWQCTPRT